MQDAANSAPSLLQRYRQVRATSEQLCRHLPIEDYGLQGVAEASPLKWHLAHVTWFFETFCLQPFDSAYQAVHPDFAVLFNSYYNGIGQQFPRAQRHLLSRPTVAEVYRYRHQVDTALQQLLGINHDAEWLRRIELGLHHEQQHQELMLTDLKWNLSFNPLYPAWHENALTLQPAPPMLQFIAFDGGESLLGHNGNEFGFDNECPRHRVLLTSFQLAQRLITNQEYLHFVQSDGYRQPEHWLADGWAWSQQQQWRHPLHWVERNGEWFEFTLHGLQLLDPARPVTHVSFYEADAFARWAGARLPTEAEWEHAAVNVPVQGHFADDPECHPFAAAAGEGLQQMFGDCWEWTASPYVAYPGFRPAAGAIGEYNGKFMCNQWVLKGGSCATPPGHVRSSYRNFFYPQDRWQFTGIRLALDSDLSLIRSL